MLVVIKSKESNIVNNNKNMFVLNEICELKKIKDEGTVILLYDVCIDKDGIVENHNIFFEEILITLEINAIISNKVNDKLHEIADFYNILLISI